MKFAADFWLKSVDSCIAVQKRIRETLNLSTCADSSTGTIKNLRNHVSCVMCHVSCVICQGHVSCVMCYMSNVTCHVLHVACHMSLTPTAVETDPANFHTMNSRMVRNNQKVLFYLMCDLRPILSRNC